MPFLDDIDSPEVLLAWQHPGALGKSRPSRDRRQFMTLLGGTARPPAARVAVRPDAADRRAHATRR